MERSLYYKKQLLIILWILTYHNFHHTSLQQVFLVDMKSFSSHIHSRTFCYHYHRFFVLICYHKNLDTHKLLTPRHCHSTQHKNHIWLNHMLRETRKKTFHQNTNYIYLQHKLQGDYKSKPNDPHQSPINALL